MKWQITSEFHFTAISYRCKSTSPFFLWFVVIPYFFLFPSNFKWGDLSDVLRFFIIILSLVAMMRCLTLSFLLVLRKPVDCGLQSFLWIQWRIRPHDLLDERGKIHRRTRRSHQRRRSQVLFGVFTVKNMVCPKSLLGFLNRVLIGSGNSFLSKEWWMTWNQGSVSCSLSFVVNKI